MKIDKDFAPVIITLETEEEVMIMRAIANLTVTIPEALPSTLKKLGNINIIKFLDNLKKIK